MCMCGKLYRIPVATCYLCGPILTHNGKANKLSPTPPHTMQLLQLLCI